MAEAVQRLQWRRPYRGYSLRRLTDEAFLPDAEESL